MSIKYTVNQQEFVPNSNAKRNYFLEMASIAHEASTLKYAQPHKGLLL